MTEAEIKKQHPTGFKGIIYFYNYKRLWKSIPFRIGLLCGMICMFLLFISGTKPYPLIERVFSLGISLFPNILGFSLGGYALIIGFSTGQSIKDYTNVAPKENGSLFQLLMSIFSISLLVNLFCVIFFYFGSVFLSTELSLLAFNLGTCIGIINIWNTLIVSFSIFISTWALLTIPYVITNLFNLGQSSHLIGTIERVIEENKPK